MEHNYKVKDATSYSIDLIVELVIDKSYHVLTKVKRSMITIAELLTTLTREWKSTDVKTLR